MPECHEINAVHKNNLEELLSSLDMLVPLKEGKITCEFCGKTITLENLQCVFPKEGEIVFCCNGIQCFQNALNASNSPEGCGKR